jgi:hypothetical protein
MSFRHHLSDVLARDGGYSCGENPGWNRAGGQAGSRGRPHRNDIGGRGVLRRDGHGCGPERRGGSNRILGHPPRPPVLAYPGTTIMFVVEAGQSFVILGVSGARFTG